MNNRFNINEEEKNRIRGLHGIQVINEQDQVAAETEALQGISLEMLHPITQQWLSRQKTMNWVQMLKMIAGCHVNDEKKPQYSALRPSGSFNYDYVHTDRKKYPITISDNNFCMIGGKTVCFNPCKLDINARMEDLPEAISDMVVPALVKMMSSSTIDNLGMDDFDDATYDRYEEGGSMLGWRGDDNGQFKLTKI